MGRLQDNQYSALQQPKKRTNKAKQNQDREKDEAKLQVIKPIFECFFFFFPICKLKNH